MSGRTTFCVHFLISLVQIFQIRAVMSILAVFPVCRAVRARIIVDQRRTYQQRLLQMVTITFADRETEKRALAFLIGRFSGRVLRSGEHLVPEAALEALADQNIPFTVRGKATYEQQMAAFRGAATPPVQ